MVFRDLALTMKDLSFDVGNQFQVVTVSMDPRDAPGGCEGENRIHPGLRPPGAAEGWHFLTGEKPAIDRLAQTVGFHYVYDPRRINSRTRPASWS